MKRLGVLFLTFVLTASVSPAFAAEVKDIAKNITESSSDLPGLVSAFSYLLALVFGISGVFKLKEHVDNPSQMPLRTPAIRFIIGGALIALPMIYEAIITTINGGQVTLFDPTSAISFMMSLLGASGYAPGANNVSAVLQNITDSFSDTPGLISAFAYMLGLIIGVSGLLKIKEHVENPEQNPLREGVIRLLVGGALFALPTVYQAMQEAIGSGSGGILSTITAILGALSFVISGYGGGTSVCNPAGNSLGSAFCGVILHAGAIPAFLTACAYMIGLIFGIWGIFKIKAHVINPAQTSLSEGVTRLLAGGAFFALPLIIEVTRNTVSLTSLIPPALAPVTGYNETGGGCDGTGGLDVALYCMMNDVLTPLHVVLNFFAFCAGVVFIMVGISRLVKSAQEGARGPGGLGTIFTFFCGGALISYNELVRAATQTMSMGQGFYPRTRTFATLPYQGGLSSDELAHAHTVISAILKFMIIVGLISFVRGIFIIRGVAEGNNQASIMAGVTHVVGGALAVNLGPLMMAVQSTLGITDYGINFS